LAQDIYTDTTTCVNCEHKQYWMLFPVMSNYLF